MSILEISLAGLAAVAQVPATDAGPQPRVVEEEARIPFAGRSTIRTFRPVGNDVVYLQDNRRNWYRATLSGPCFNLDRSLRIGVDTRYGSTLDNTSSFIVGGERCPIHSLVRGDPPPRRER